MDEDILQEFLTESWENLGRLDIEIVSLEKDPSDGALLASIFRTIHTIKGTCGFIGLARLGGVAHAAENVLGQMRDGRLAATPANISLVLRAVDEIKALLSGLEQTGQEPVLDHSELIAALNRLAESPDAAPAPAAVPTPAAAAAPVMAAALSTPRAVEPAAELEPRPSSDPAIPVADVDPGAAEADPGKKTIADLSIRVNVDVLDSLMNLVGELVLTRNQLLQMVRGEDESKYSGPITHLNRVTTDLQEGVMKTRMQPIGNAWSKLPRLVRDLANLTGKQIQLDMFGADTELDRTVLDAIKDPLTHMVRNSADHGLESPQARRALGKPESGRIKLNAFHEGGHVVICIEDDGAGINVAKVKQKAIKSGLVSEADAARLSDKEVLQFIFEAGLSTADKISSVSGRGVGMDVVRTEIQRIGGTVDLSSKPNVGTTIRIKIPLTLAIVSALVVESGGLSFAIPQLGVVELVRLAAEDRHKIERVNKNEVFRLRNRLLPLVHLHDVLGLADHGVAERDTNIVVVQVGEEQFGLVVSSVFDTEEIVVKPVGQLLKDIEIYQGTTILGDGRVIMILDVSGIASKFVQPASHAAERDAARRDELDGEVPPTSLLVFSSGSETPMCVPLSLVARLEEFPRSAIERTGDRHVVQYRGDLLPLMAIEGVRGEPAADLQPVIVFSEGSKSLGLMVHRIQDILEEQLIIRIPTRRPGIIGTAIVNGAATDVLDINHYVNRAAPDWFEKQPVRTVRRVLVVDDSIFFRQLVATTLQSEGFRVQTVEGAVQAVELLQRGTKFDLIVSDLEMPQMDGFEFATWVRKEFGDRLPMIALSSATGLRVDERARAAGFDEFQRKFNAEQFVDAVRGVSQAQRNVLTGATA